MRYRDLYQVQYPLHNYLHMDLRGVVHIVFCPDRDSRNLCTHNVIDSYSDGWKHKFPTCIPCLTEYTNQRT